MIDKAPIPSRATHAEIVDALAAAVGSTADVLVSIAARTSADVEEMAA
ncbi:hypothetical protein ND748_03470 [Frankia sp. AiPs1]|nr:hypothetical protein [Frankia sp. AiPs1]MCM3920736.1 hypothetical protein [Frankia sp. AiPs1]